MDWPTVSSHSSVIQSVALALSALAAVGVVGQVARDYIEMRRHPLPPGPTPIPLLGSALSINPREPWLTYTAWQKKYGDVMHVQLLDANVIVLNTYADAVELLEKRSQIYSDRPFIIAIEPYGHGANVGFARYGPRWRLGRRIMHQTFRAEASRAFRPMQICRSRQAVINIINDPKEFPAYYSLYGASVVMSIAYDHEPKSPRDPLVQLINNFCEASVPSLTPEMSVLLKVFPFLLSVPEWIPGLSRIRRDTRKASELGAKVLNTPYQLVRMRMASKEDIAADTLLFDHIQRMEKFEGSQRIEYEEALKGASLTSFIGSVETTAGTLMTFTLAMVKNPRVWKLAQAEIDALVGTDRLPEFDDRPSLPYIEAILRETMRWIPVGPAGVPHAATTEDIYKGYYIPRGATIFTNIWAMARDEIRYPDPESFIPERFLNPDGTLKDDDPADFVFGFGRRRCVGRHIADASIWAGMVTLLATLDFNAVKDEHGKDIEFKAKFVNGLTHHPVSIPCNIVPRAHITEEALQRLLVK